MHRGMTNRALDPRVSSCLGRVLGSDGEVAGMCFQLMPCVVATAWHVLEDLGVGAVGAEIAVDPFAGGDRIAGAVAAIDEPSDLAVVRLATEMPATVVGVAPTDSVAPDELVAIVGVVRTEEDVEDQARYHTAEGIWLGVRMRGDQQPLGLLSCATVQRGMSGTPVIRMVDGVVVGVVSGRFNSRDGWLHDAVWVARCERLRTLCADIAPLMLDATPQLAPIDLELTVDSKRVRLAGQGVDVSASHGGESAGLTNAADETRRARANAGSQRDDIGLAPSTVALDRAGRLLAKSFLPAPVATELREWLDHAERSHQPLRLGIACEDPYTRLPWEALAAPRTERPLALHPLVSVHRRVNAGTPAAVPGPLRILVAISAPDDSSGLDYERELRQVLTAVRAARDGNAHVRIVPFATTAQIRAALEVEPVHVLHMSGHGSPGSLLLEHDDGRGREVDADTFVDEAIPPGGMPAVVALAACHTNVSSAAEVPSFAGRLAERGASVVIATETSVTDIYATKTFARIYGRLAEAVVPDPIAAVGEARRAVQAELEAATRGRDLTIAGRGEWAVLSVLAGAGSVTIFDPAVVTQPPPAPKRFGIGRVTARAVGEFVGRRGAQRRWPNELLAPGRAGMVLHGIGGIGKTTLAAELVTHVVERESAWQPVVIEGELSFEVVLSEIVAALRERLSSSQQYGGSAADALEQAARSDLPWPDRLAHLRRVPTVAGVPLLVVLDNFEDNLDRDVHGAAVREPTLGALLAAIIAEPGAWRLLITSRFKFTLPDDAHRELTFHEVGALSAAETRKLIWSLPGLDRLLDDAQVDKVWRMLGGHPRSLEYLDALLSDGAGRYPDIELRLEAALRGRLAPGGADLLKTAWQLDTAIAEVATLAADDILLGDLLASLSAIPGARELLIGASVYRKPIDINALLFQVGDPDDTLASVPRNAASAQIRAIFESAGIAVDAPFSLAELPADVQSAVQPYLADLSRPPTPPRRPPADLQARVDACVASTLLSLQAAAEPGSLAFVHRWTASELERRLVDTDDRDLVAAAHRCAAAYWRWHADVWPQDSSADVNDLLEARHHLIVVGDQDADRVTRRICAHLSASGAWTFEATLARDALARAAPNTEPAAHWMLRLGGIAYHRGQFSEAEAQLRRALDVYRRVDHQAGIAACHEHFGMLAHSRSAFDESETQYRLSLAIHTSLGDQANIASLQESLGALARSRHNFDEAEAEFRRASDIYAQIGDRAGAASSHALLGQIAMTNAKPREAREHQLRALEFYEADSDQTGIANTLDMLATLAQITGDLAEAEAYYHRSLEIDERLGRQESVSSTCHALGVLAHKRGDLAEAERQVRRSLETDARLGRLENLAANSGLLGNYAQERGDYAEAEQHYRRGLDLLEQLGLEQLAASSLRSLGSLARDRGDFAEAERQYQHALKRYQELGMDGGIPFIYRELGAVAQDRGDLAEAEVLYGQSLDLHEQPGGSAFGLALTLGRLGSLAAAHDQLELAISRHGRALSIRAQFGFDAVDIDDVGRLRELRQRVGPEVFERALTSSVDADRIGEILRLLDDSEQDRAH